MIDNNASSSGITKKQLVINMVEDAIAARKYQKGTILPSVNKLGEEFGMSRLTVMSAYRDLQSRGIIDSSPGKGYFVISERSDIQQRVFLLFDELNGFKEDLYNAFIEGMGTGAFIDIYFHHFNIDQFHRLIRDSAGKYTAYVIMPVGFKGIYGMLDYLKGQRLYILDQSNPELPVNLPIVYQDFERDTYEGLVQAKERLGKYEKLVLSHYEHYRKPAGILKGFQRFCRDYGFENEIEPSIRERKITKGEVYVLTEDRNLIYTVLEAQKKNLVPGRDIGIIAYNETELRKVIANGITTISTDFIQMGRNLAKMIKNQEKNRIVNPSSLILRGSL